MADHMRTDLVLTALKAALGQRIPAQSGLVFHSDRGSQYASSDYRSALECAGIICSMSRKGNCEVPRTVLRRPQNNVKHWDNAVAESFNRKRLHSTIGYISPVKFEENYWANQYSLT